MRFSCEYTQEIVSEALIRMPKFADVEQETTVSYSAHKM